jgi:hypothetical protein
LTLKRPLEELLDLVMRIGERHPDQHPHPWLCSGVLGVDGAAKHGPALTIK